MSASSEVIDGRLRTFYDSELNERRTRPIGAERERLLASFIARCAAEGRQSVVEVGCGAGRDGKILSEAGLRYTGVDLSPVGVKICRGSGLEAHEASATELPFPSHSYDAGWSMSTLMHLPDEALERALSELRRVIVPDGILEVGLWGKTDGDWTDPHGRYFRQRTDENVQALLATIGDVRAFDTWYWLDDGGHYQWARIRVS